MAFVPAPEFHVRDGNVGSRVRIHEFVTAAARPRGQDQAE
jgi:hypothetical protein